MPIIREIDAGNYYGRAVFADENGKELMCLELNWSLAAATEEEVEASSTVMHCESEKTPKKAPLSMTVVNPTKLPVTVRACNKYDPVSGAACSGNPLKARHYNDCPQDLAPNTNATITFDADTQYIAFVNGNIELSELWAKKSDAPWPAEYRVPSK